MTATRLELTCATHSRSCQTGTPSLSSFSSFAQLLVWWLELPYGELNKLDLPPMVAEPEEHEAPDYRVPLLFSFFMGPSANQV